MLVRDLIKLLRKEDQEMDVVFTIYDDENNELGVSIEDVSVNCIDESHWIMCLDERGVTEKDLDKAAQVVVLR